MGAFKQPHGGELRELYLPEHVADEIKQLASEYPSWDLTPRQLCDLDLLLNGAFSPLEGFLGEADYEQVCDEMRLQSGVLWPIPVTLDVSEAFAEGVGPGTTIALRDAEGVLIATMDVAEAWTPDKQSEARRVFGTTDDSHPGVDYLFHQAGTVYLGGKVHGVEPPTFHDFKLLRDTPSELRGRFRKLGWRKVVAFQTRSPLHRAQQELTFRAAREAEANLLIHPVVGMTGPGDIDHFTRVRCYEHVLEEYPEQTTTLSLLNLAMRMAGPREALWHGIIRKNYGCTHFIVGRDHAGPGDDRNGEPFYGPYDAQALFKQHQEELDITMVPLKQVVYVENKAEFMGSDETEPGDRISELSEAEFCRRLREDLDIPEWFSFPKVVEELRRAHPPKYEQGFTVFFTGLSGSGKSTVANALMIKLMEDGTRPVTLLDGDIVRKNLSSELTFSKEHRDLNIQRIGFVASEITKNRGIAICAPIAPYTHMRRLVREMISRHGGFIEVHVATPLEVCEARDRKGLYAKARAGLVKGFTGIDDPYQAPEHAEIVIDTQELSPDLAAHRILITLEKLGYLR
jgi:sulfate adenylyltransferase